MTARPTAARQRYPFLDHRTQAEIMFGPLSLVPGSSDLSPHSNHRDGLASTRGAAASFTPVRGAATSSAVRR
jgi:hypothetical protein